MASDQTKPKKGILKTSTSFDKDGMESSSKQAKWDEMNILATYHPADKDYGHMKINEPHTPYSHMDTEMDSGDERKELCAETLASKLSESDERKEMEPDDESSDEDVVETEEQKAHKKAFEQKRKLHYNEFQAVKLARQLLEDEDDENEDATNEGNVEGGESTAQEPDS